MAYFSYVGMMVFFEFFESWWQHDTTVGGMLEKIQALSRTNIFLLFAMHPSFWLVLFIYVARGFHGTMLAIILVMKATDIAFKLWMIDKTEHSELPPDLQAMLSLPLSSWMPWINVIVYPLLLIFALGPL